MQMARMLGEQGYHVASVVGGYEAMKKISKNYFKNRENM
jgi:thiosulfate sulfurtransferase